MYVKAKERVLNHSGPLNYDYFLEIACYPTWRLWAKTSGAIEEVQLFSDALFWKNFYSLCRDDFLQFMQHYN
jgi:hypothetical protein